jgi:hypothetical protein
MSPQQEAATRLLAQMQRKMLALDAAANAAGGVGLSAGDTWSRGGGLKFDSQRGSGAVVGGQALEDVGLGLYGKELAANTLGANQVRRSDRLGAGAEASQGGAAAAGVEGNSHGGSAVGVGGLPGSSQEPGLFGHDALTGARAGGVVDDKLLTHVGRAVQVPEGKELRPRKKEAAQLALQVMLGGKKKR